MNVIKETVKACNWNKYRNQRCIHLVARLQWRQHSSFLTWLESHLLTSVSSAVAVPTLFLLLRNLSLVVLPSIANKLLPIKYSTNYISPTIITKNQTRDFTKLLSSVGSDAFRIWSDSSIFLIWSEVYLNAVNAKPHFLNVQCKINNKNL